MNVDTDVRNLFDEVAVNPIVIIPIDATVQTTLREDFAAFSVVTEKNNDEKPARVDVFSNTSEDHYIDVFAKRTPLSIADSKAYILKNMWKTPMVNHFTDLPTGKTNVFEFPWFSSL